MFVMWIYVLMFSFICYKQVSSGTLNDTRTLVEHLMINYNRNARPVNDQALAVSVNSTLWVKSIQEFDEVKGMFSFIGAFPLVWYDENMKWDPSKYGNVQSVVIPYPDVWAPEMILSTPSSDVDSLGKKWNRIRFEADGRALWIPVDLIRSTCFVDVRNYPFDTQKCETSFTSILYYEWELRLVAGSTKINKGIYQENTLWDMLDTDISVVNITKYSNIIYTFHLKRKPTFILVNVILPIFCLSLLNTLVFILVPESGERVSYSVTVLLSIAVFMTIVSDMLPRSSQPVPIISYKLMIDMISSSLIVLVTILNFRIYSKDDREPVPKWLTSVYKVLTCTCQQGRKLRLIKPENTGTGAQPYLNRTEKALADDCKLRGKTVHLIVGQHFRQDLNHETADSNTCGENITWQHISYMLDMIFLIFFVCVSVMSFIAFFIKTGEGT